MTTEAGCATSHTDASLDALRRLADAGALYVLLPPRSKVPTSKAWQHQRCDWSDVEAHLRKGGNAGLLLIDGWTDIDLDSDEAIKLAVDFLPPTGCTFGRNSARESHWIFRCDSSATYRKYSDPLETTNDDRGTLLELRAGSNGKSLQTVVPGSTHPNGESITFDASGDPAHVDGTALMRDAADLAAACLLGRHWPRKGTRHDAALALAGFLLRNGLSSTRTTRIVCGAARASGDEEWRERRHDVESTAAALRESRRVTGGPTLAELVGAKILDKLSTWLELRSNGSFSANRAGTASAANGATAEDYGPAANEATSDEEGDYVSSAYGADGLVDIIVSDRPLRDQTRDAVDALTTANKPPHLFVRDARLARVRRDERDAPRIEVVTEHSLRGRLARVANFLEVREFNKGASRRNVSPPTDLVRDVLALPSHPFPALEAIVEAPVLRPDGTVLMNAGYDPATRLVYFPPAGFTVPPIPDRPSRQHVAKAVAEIDAVFSDFPFVDDASRANLYGLLLTPLARPAFDGLAPLALLDKPTAGTGATLLAKIVARLTTGRDAALMMAPREDEEFRKRVTALLLSGATFTVIDNVTGRLTSPILSAVLTATTWEDRLLGGNEMVQLPHRCTWLATGNNLTLGGDLARRSYWIRLDANQERPWERTTFKIPSLEEHVQINRGRLLAALLTICRAWFVAGKPAANGPVIGSFEAWARMIGDMLAFAGIAGFLANLSELYDQIDEEAAAWAVFFAAWHAQFGDGATTVKQLTAALKEGASALREALPPELAGALEGEGSFTHRLGKALSARRDRIHGELRLERADDDKHAAVARWRVCRVSRVCSPLRVGDTHNSPRMDEGETLPPNPQTLHGIPEDQAALDL